MSDSNASGLHFSICPNGSGPFVRNFYSEKHDFDFLVANMAKGKPWDGVEQPPVVTEHTLLWDHKTYNGYIGPVFLPKPNETVGRSGRRSKLNVATSSLICLDFDAMPVGTLAKLLKELDAECAQAIVYTTYNHLRAEKGGHERFRAVIVVDRPMTIGEIMPCTWSMFSILKDFVPALIADNASFRLSQPMYRPPENSEIHVIDGTPWPVADLLADHAELEANGLGLPMRFTTEEDNGTPATPDQLAHAPEWIEWAKANRYPVVANRILVPCPNNGEHTSDDNPTATVVMLPTAAYGEARIHCMHDHCADVVNSHQHDSFLDLSDDSDVPIPAHLIPEAHDAVAKEKAAMRELVGEVVPHDGKRERDRKEGAVDYATLSHWIGGKVKMTIARTEVERLAAYSQVWFFAVVNGRSKYVIETVNSQTGQKTFDALTMEAFHDLFITEEPVRGTYKKEDGSLHQKTVALTEAMHNWAGRSVKSGGVGLYPDASKCPENVLNTWPGFAVRPVEGDATFFKEYITDVLCNADKELAHYAFQYLGHMVQKPSEKPGVAWVMISGEGNGKGRLSDILKKLFGPLRTHFNGMDKVVGQFNTLLSSSLAIFIDEAKVTPSQMGTLRNLVTEKDMVVEAKGVDARTADSFCRVFIASNEQALALTKGDRRYLVLPLNPRYANNPNNPEQAFAADYWFNQFAPWFDRPESIGEVLYFLQHYPLADFNSYSAPATKAHRELVADSIPPHEFFLLRQLQSENIPRLVGKGIGENAVAIGIPELVSAYFKDCKEKGMRVYQTERALESLYGRIFAKTGIQKSRVSIGGKQRGTYVFDSFDHALAEVSIVVGVDFDDY